MKKYSVFWWALGSLAINFAELAITANLAANHGLHGVSFGIACMYLGMAISPILAIFFKQHSIRLAFFLSELLKLGFLVLSLLSSSLLVQCISLGGIFATVGWSQGYRAALIKCFFSDRLKNTIVNWQLFDSVFACLGLALGMYELEIGLSFGILILQLPCLYLAISSKDMNHLNRQKPLVAALKVFGDSNIRTMTLGRLGSNIALGVAKLVIPLWVLKSNADFLINQGAHLLTIALMGLFVNLCIKRMKNLSLVLSIGTVSLLSLYLLMIADYFSVEPLTVIILSAMMGIQITSYRTVGIFLGQNITDADDMDVIIPVSDSLIRGITAAILMLISFFLDQFSHSLQWIMVLGLMAVSFCHISFARLVRNNPTFNTSF